MRVSNLEKPLFMSTISFSLAPHSVRPGEEIVQILLNGAVVGAVYADQQKQGIKVVSVHMSDKKLDPAFEGVVVDDDGSKSFPHIPALHVTFKLSPWSLTPGGRVFKHTN